MKILRTDVVAEYGQESFLKWLKELHIDKQTSFPYHQSENGQAERSIQTVNNMIHCMLLQSGLPKYMWAEALCYAAFIINCLPCHGQLASPYEILNGRHRTFIKSSLLDVKPGLMYLL